MTDAAKSLSVQEMLGTFSSWLSSADKVLSAAYHARDGGVVSRVLAAATGAKHLIDLFVPYRSATERLMALGYKRVPTGIGEFLCRRLHASGAKQRSVAIGETFRIIFWTVGERKDLVAAIFDGDDCVGGPFTASGSTDDLSAAIESVSWDASNDLMLGVGPPTIRRAYGDNPDSPTRQFELHELEPPGTWIGEPGVQWFVDRLRKHKGETRSMLLVGPTGVGKSTLGRLIAKASDGGRLLKVSAAALRQCATTDIIDLARFLRPSVLLLDDVSMIDDHTPNDGMLELMETLRGKSRLVIATLMQDANNSPRRRRGDTEDSENNYFHGMRPGRIDECVRVKRPAPRVVREILLHYLGGEEPAAAIGVNGKLLNDVVERCAGLTGAYICEVAKRLKVHGVDTYKSEIASVVSAAPSQHRFFMRDKLTRSKRRRQARQNSTPAIRAQLRTLEAAAETVALKSKRKKRTQ